MMGKERFSLKEWEDVNYCEHCFYDGESQLSDNDVVRLLNDQQATILQLEKNFDDLVKWASEIAKRNVVLDEKIGEQQATIEHLTKSRDKWRELSNSFSFYCKCYEKAIERAFEEKPYPTEDDINRIYAELEKELEE